MDENQEVVFDNINVLAKFVCDNSIRKMTPLRLQKTLYFLFAFYGATYGLLNNENVEEKHFEGSADYPKHLFKENFEAWQYGPVIREIYKNNKYHQDVIESSEIWQPANDQEDSIKELLIQVIHQTDEMGDFTLVERTHEDLEWKRAFDDGQGEMNKESIIEEYKLEVF
jgi:uncharacterized phage-associated protein